MLRMALNFSLALSCLLAVSMVSGQERNKGFRYFAMEESDSFRLDRPFRITQILCSRTGFHKFISSFGLIRDQGMQIEMILYSGPDGNQKMTRNYIGEDGIRAMYEGNSKFVFFATHDNRILWQPSDDGGFGYSPFRFPPAEDPGVSVSTIWIDQENNLYIGTHSNGFYFIKQGAVITAYDGTLDSSGNFIVTKGKKEVQHVSLGKKIGVFAFTEYPHDKNHIVIGTNQGILTQNKSTWEIETEMQGVAVTHLETDSAGNIWFSSLEKGMGYFQPTIKTTKYFSDPKKHRINQYPIKTFCRKSGNEFFVAVLDSVPAIFNTSTAVYTFIEDTLFKKTADSTTDIKLDGFGNLFVAKGGGLFYTNFYKESKPFADAPVNDEAYAPFISEILVNNMPYIQGSVRGLKTIELRHDQRSLTIEFALAELIERSNVQFAWKADGYINEWIVLPVRGNEVPAMLSGLAPGRYVFRLKARVGDEDWRTQQARLVIIVGKPVWKAWWFWAGIIGLIAILSYLLVQRKIKSVKRQERVKAAHEKELLEMEAMALRAQMNPHFIFNCLNSIKALIQNRDDERAIEYLITFSKLIRTLFQNSDKRQISLYDEIETCRLYTQLEAMRLNGRLNYFFNIDPGIDIKSVMVPALIIQPFIENAIWHGIVPKDGGSVKVTVKGDEKSITCEVEDDGIGRTMSKLNKPGAQLGHESKGVKLSQARMNLERLLNETQASIETIDLYDNEMATGTRVIIRFNLN